MPIQCWRWLSLLCNPYRISILSIIYCTQNFFFRDETFKTNWACENCGNRLQKNYEPFNTLALWIVIQIVLSFQNKEKSNKAKYMGGFQERQSLVDNNDIYHNLHVDHELAKLPDLPKPPLLKVNVLMKQKYLNCFFSLVNKIFVFIRMCEKRGLSHHSPPMKI